jgi:hypothetical protein
LDDEEEEEDDLDDEDEDDELDVNTDDVDDISDDEYYDDCDDDGDDDGDDGDDDGDDDGEEEDCEENVCQPTEENNTCQLENKSQNASGEHVIGNPMTREKDDVDTGDFENFEDIEESEIGKNDVRVIETEKYVDKISEKVYTDVNVNNDRHTGHNGDNEHNEPEKNVKIIQVESKQKGNSDFLKKKQSIKKKLEQLHDKININSSDSFF